MHQGLKTCIKFKGKRQRSGLCQPGLIANNFSSPSLGHLEAFSFYRWPGSASCFVGKLPVQKDPS